MNPIYTYMIWMDVFIKDLTPFKNLCLVRIRAVKDLLYVMA
jgi:hypothetical protein